MAALTQAQKLDQLLEQSRAVAASFQALVLQATTDNPPPRKISTKDAYGNQVEFEPDMVFLMVELRKPVKGVPNTYTPATRCLIDRATEGRILTIDLDGRPADVRRQIGGRAPVENVILETPVTITTASSVAEVNAAIAAMGGTVTDGAGAVWTLGPNGETLRNGADFGGRGTQYALLAGKVYVLGLNDRWWEAAADHWVEIGDLPTGD